MIKDSNFQITMYNPHSKSHSFIHEKHTRSYQRNQILKEIGQVREDIVRFKSEMNGLAKQMNGIELYLNHSKHRVYEIEKGLTATQEVNVNLQVLLEKAVHKQKESDVYATRAMKHIHTNLATVVYETGKLNGRLISIAKYQKKHQGSAHDVVERMKEYTSMLDGAIQDLHDTKSRTKEYRTIKKRTTSSSSSSWLLPQKGLRILLNDYQGY